MTNFRGFSYPSAMQPAKTQWSIADGDSFTCVPR
ncbi:hypothetical protein SEA_HERMIONEGRANGE_74 [Mycobacterium phage HermioneGrange]|nr:hypothetical protein SEA_HERMIONEGRANGE_74 [Mycobacterium phage HermioneGrange]